MILVHKGFVRHSGSPIKFMLASVLHDPRSAHSNEWAYRLPDSDPREFAAADGMQWLNEWFARLPIGCWCRIMYPTADRRG